MYVKKKINFKVLSDENITCSIKCTYILINYYLLLHVHVYPTYIFKFLFNVSRIKNKKNKLFL